MQWGFLWGARRLQLFCDGVFVGLVVGQGAVCICVCMCVCAPAFVHMKSVDGIPVAGEAGVQGEGRRGVARRAETVGGWRPRLPGCSEPTGTLSSSKPMVCLLLKQLLVLK